jgi:hypothetical protein
MLLTVSLRYLSYILRVNFKEYGLFQKNETVDNQTILDEVIIF